MNQNQSALGGRTIHRMPSHTQSKIGRVTSIVDYEDYGKIEVVFLDYGMPFPVWVVGDLDREPVTGDQVIIGYMEGRKDAPYLAGFIKNESYTSNFIQVAQDKVRMQLPVFEVGERDKDAHNEVKTALIKDTRPQGNSLTHHRAYMEITPEHAHMSFPVDPGFVIPPATVDLTKDGAVVRYYYTPSDYAEVALSASETKLLHMTGNVTVSAPKGSATISAQSVTISGGRTETF